jgi:hypothetical protein
MGLKSQFQVKARQAKKRKKARAKLTKKGLNLTDYYYNKFYLK